MSIATSNYVSFPPFRAKVSAKRAATSSPHTRQGSTYTCLDRPTGIAAKTADATIHS